MSILRGMPESKVGLVTNFNVRRWMRLASSPMTGTVSLLLQDQWEAVWVSSNRYRSKLPPAPFCRLSAEAEAELHKVRGTKLTGCWDVFAFKNRRVLFIECKRKSGDAIILSQREWLSAALKVGFTLDNFLIVEWTAEEV